MFDGLLDAIKSWFISLLENTVYRLIYYVEIAVLWVVSVVEDMMEIFTGEQPVSYNNEDTVLINVFFNHKAVRGIYGAMAMIGIVFAFVFAIVAVIRKILDLRDKQQGVTMGTILGNLLRSILIIASMNFIMLISIEATNILVQQVSYAVQNGEGLAAGGAHHEFTDEEYAAMGRIINTIGNYSINPSYRSRYNINACYNDIRADLQYMGNQGVFNFHYVTIDDSTKKVIPTWQSLMEELARAYDYTSEVALDSYDDGLTNAMLDCMELLKANPNMKVLDHYDRQEVTASDSSVPMDRVLFLCGTMGSIGDFAAARNPAYNKNPSFFDNVRLPFYTGESDIYDFDEVRRVFYVDPLNMNYVLVYFAAIAILKEMIVVIVTCSVRIFNLLALYLASPLVIAPMPLDDGGKLKQWITAFVVQLLTIVGMVLSIRLYLMFLPIIWSPDLKVGSGFGGVILTLAMKMLIMYGAIHGVNRVNGIFTGILADSAGYQAISAGNMRDTVENSSVGQKLSGMSAGAMTEKVGGQVGKLGSFVAGKTGLGKVTDALGWTKDASKNYGQKSPEKQAAQAQTKERERQRSMKALQADYDYASKNGTHIGGKALKKGELDKMGKTLKYMGDGKSMKEAKSLASVDMKQDKLDLKAEAGREAKMLKNPPPSQKEQV